MTTFSKKPQIRKESIHQLQAAFIDNPVALDDIQMLLSSIPEYADAIFRLEMFEILGGKDDANPEQHSALNQKRTDAHDRVISFLENLNRICAGKNIPLIYNGELSRARPCRIEVADAVLSFLTGVLENRVR